MIFVWLGSAAEDFFVPQMEAIVKSLRLSQNVAGVTFLAVANGAPDMVGSIIAVNSGSADLAVSQLIGVRAGRGAARAGAGVLARRRSQARAPS